MSGVKLLCISSGLSVVLSKLTRSLFVPPKSHTLGFLPPFSGVGLLGLFLKHVIQLNKESITYRSFLKTYFGSGFFFCIFLANFALLAANVSSSSRPFSTALGDAGGDVFITLSEMTPLENK